MSLIGIVGLAGAGKDTFCDLLLQKLPEYKRYSYADPLKEFVRGVFGLSYEQCYDPKLKEVCMTFDFSYSELQMKFEAWFDIVAPTWSIRDRNDVYFTQMLRSLKNEYHVKSGFTNKLMAFLGLEHRIVFYTSPRKLLQLIGTDFFRTYVSNSFWVDKAPTQHTIIPDVRFQNEVEHITSNGGLIIKIVDPTLNQIETSNHVSENLARSNISGAIVVINDKTKGIEGLHSFVDLVLDRVSHETNKN
jgi:hypothetical protein